VLRLYRSIEEILVRVLLSSVSLRNVVSQLGFDLDSAAVGYDGDKVRARCVDVSPPPAMSGLRRPACAALAQHAHEPARRFATVLAQALLLKDDVACSLPDHTLTRLDFSNVSG